ncbi:T0000308 isoform 2, partial [Pongo abelii]
LFKGCVCNSEGGSHSVKPEEKCVPRDRVLLCAQAGV